MLQKIYFMVFERYIPELKKYDSNSFLHQPMASGQPLKIVQRHMAHPVYVFNPIFVFQPESCPEADSSMSQDRRSGSFGYRRRSKSMERKDSVRRRSLDNEANDESSLTVEKGRIF